MEASGASTVFTTVICDLNGFVEPSAVTRLKLHTTSCAVSFWPSWKVTPSRSLNEYLVPSSDTFHSLASSGSTSPVPAFWRTRPSYTL